MSWSGKSFASRHNKRLSGKGAAKAASIASAIVREGGDEGVAIATANKYAKKRELLRKRGLISDNAQKRMDETAPHRQAQARLVKAGKLIKQVVGHERSSIREMKS